ncbi:MAG: TetR/AcrR family transcriptional regulator [Bacteroidota bacterium]
MNSTKNRILEAALELFNERGLKNTTLQIIANKLDISVGNLAYHYKNKPEIISAHNQSLEEQITVALSHFRNYPNFLDFQIQLDHIFEVIECYQYIFINIGEIKALNQDTFETVSSFHSKLILQLESRLEYNLERAVINVIPEKTITKLASNIADLIFFSPTHSLFESEIIAQDKYQKIWSTLTPILSPKGASEWNTLISPILTQ